MTTPLGIKFGCIGASTLVVIKSSVTLISAEAYNEASGMDSEYSETARFPPSGRQHMVTKWYVAVFFYHPMNGDFKG